MTILRIEDPSRFVGLPLGKVLGQIADCGYQSLIIKADNITKEIVHDYDPLRVLLQVEKNIVTTAKVG
jgi:hypothetical protein